MGALAARARAMASVIASVDEREGAEGATGGEEEEEEAACCSASCEPRKVICCCK